MAVSVVVANDGAYTSGPTVSASWTPLEGDLVLAWMGSTSSVSAGSGASGWADVGTGAINPGDASMGMGCAYHVVTAGEQTAGTTSWDLTGYWSGAETGRWVVAVLRGADPTAPIDAAGSWSTPSTPSTHVLAGLSGASLSTSSLVVSCVMSDGANATRTTPSGWTQVRQGTGNNSPWLGSLDALTSAGTDVAATNIATSAADEGISITVAVAVLAVASADVDPDDASHAHTATSPTLVLTHLLQPASATHAHTATSPPLGAQHDLTPNSATHAHAASSPTLVQAHLLQPDSATHAHTATSPSLTLPLTAARFALARQRRVFFGHQSVGAQVITGINEWADNLGQPDMPVVDVDVSAIPGTGGVMAHAYVGTNGDGRTKTRGTAGAAPSFDYRIRNGLASQIDTAVLKFCYADVRSTSPYTPAELFTEYAATMDALVADFPAIAFIFATETIVMEVDEDGDDNDLRYAYNQAVRAAYASGGRLWDIALAESTAADGTRVIDGSGVEHLWPTYASADQEHIGTTAGRMAASKPLLLLLAEIEENSTGTHTLSPNSAMHEHTATYPTLGQTYMVTPDDASHAQTASSPVVQVTGSVQPDIAIHGHAAISPTVTQTHVATPASCLHAQTTSSPVVRQTHRVSPGSVTHAHTAASPPTGSGHIVTPASSTHGQTATSPIVTSRHVVTTHNCVHAHTATSPVLGTVLAPADLTIHTGSAGYTRIIPGPTVRRTIHPGRTLR